MLNITDGATHHKMVTGLEKDTEYEFEVLAYTSVGDGPKSSPVMVRTMKDGKNLQIMCNCCALSLILSKLKIY